MEVEVSGDDSGCGMALVRELWRPKVHCGSAVSGELTVEGAVEWLILKGEDCHMA